MRTKFYFPFIILFLNFTSGIGQNITKLEIENLDRISYNINVDSSYNNGSWEPLLGNIIDKRIILLGEFNHGSKEIFVSRNDLIKAIYHKFGIEVILFESGIGEMAAIDLNRENISASHMTLGFFGGWRTQEFKALMEFVKENNISIGGFDVQRTGRSFNHLLNEQAQQNGIDSMYYDNVENRFAEVKKKLSNKNIDYESVKLETQSLVDDYKKLRKLLENRISNDSGKELLLTNRTIINRIEFLEYQLDFKRERNWSKRWRARDSIMSKNIEWLLNSIYPEKKVMVIAHNYHIAKFNEKEEVMGEFLRKKMKSEMYTIGVFAKSGSFLGNYGTVENLVAPDSTQLDIKHIAKNLKGKINYIEIPVQRSESNNWLFNKIIINDSFIDLSGTNEMILAKHFDGILILEEVSPAKKIDWN